MTGVFNPQTAVISGGASGIGLAIAKRMAGQGAKVIIADLAGPALDRVKALENITAIFCDVSDLGQLEALADAAFAQFETVDLVLNNAGQGGVHGPMWEVDPDVARAHFDVNFWGIWNGCRAFAPLGPERFMKFGMDVDQYVDIVLPQIQSRRRFVVSHGYNKVRIDERMNELAASYDKFALPAHEDAKHDVQLVIAQMRNAAGKS